MERFYYWSGLKINLAKTKLLITGKKHNEIPQSGKHPVLFVELELVQIRSFAQFVINGVTKDVRGFEAALAVDEILHVLDVLESMLEIYMRWTTRFNWKMAL